MYYLLYLFTVLSTPVYLTHVAHIPILRPLMLPKSNKRVITFIVISSGYLIIVVIVLHAWLHTHAAAVCVCLIILSSNKWS